MINIKTLLIFIYFSFLLTGCKDITPHVGKWSYGQSDGWYPLKLRRKPVYLDSEQAFINSHSLVVNCHGKAIKMGKNLYVFIDDQDNGMFYDKSKSRIVETHPAGEVFETNERPLQNGDSLHVDQTLRGSGNDTKNQCGDFEHQFRRYPTPML